MRPFLAVRLEQCHEQPGALSSYVIADTAYDAKCEILRLEAALREAASFPCTCHEGYYSRGLVDPYCMADLVSDDARVALGEAEQCKGRAAAKAKA